jgi:osmoprotectant transport system ATP-binding protein
VWIRDKGKIQQFDTPRNIAKNPANDFVKSLIKAHEGK